MDEVDKPLDWSRPLWATPDVNIANQFRDTLDLAKYLRLTLSKQMLYWQRSTTIALKSPRWTGLSHFEESIDTNKVQLSRLRPGIGFPAREARSQRRNPALSSPIAKK